MDAKMGMMQSLQVPKLFAKLLPFTKAETKADRKRVRKSLIAYSLQKPRGPQRNTSPCMKQFLRLLLKG